MCFSLVFYSAVLDQRTAFISHDKILSGFFSLLHSGQIMGVLALFLQDMLSK